MSRARARSCAIAATFIVHLLITACSSPDSPTPRADSSKTRGSTTPGPSTDPDTRPVDSDREPTGCDAGSLSVREQAALVVFAGMNGDPGEAVRAIEAGYGGIFVTSATAGQLAEGTLGALLAEHGSTALVGIDQEGGRVQRLSDPQITLPSPRRMGSELSTGQIEQSAERLGDRLVELGVTVDFAPSVDVSDQPDDSVIGDRSFSADPARAAEAAVAFARGLEEAGVLPVFKHFPGHGRSSGDSHDTLVTTPPLEQLRAVDLAAFEEALREVPHAAVMVGHLIVPDLTDGRPASVSVEAITGLLRAEMGFDGLVITDDLGAMAGIRDLYDTPQAAVESAAAGADLVLVPEADADAVVRGLVDAVDRGRMPAAQLGESAQRVLDAQRRPSC